MISDVTYTNQALLNSTKALEAKYRKAGNYKDNDIIRVYKLPKKAIGKKSGFTYKPMSAKAGRLDRKSKLIGSSITKTIYSNLPADEKRTKLFKLRCQLKYVNNELYRELNRSPRVSVIIEEADS